MTSTLLTLISGAFPGASALSLAVTLRATSPTHVPSLLQGSPWQCGGVSGAQSCSEGEHTPSCWGGKGVSRGGQGSQGSREAEGGPPYTRAHTYLHAHTYTQALPQLGQRDTFSIINDLIQERNHLSESGLYFGPGGGRGKMGSWGFITSRALCCGLCSQGE